MGSVLGHRSDDGQSERDGAANGVAKDAKGEYYGMVIANLTCLLTCMTNPPVHESGDFRRGDFCPFQGSMEYFTNRRYR